MRYWPQIVNALQLRNDGQVRNSGVFLRDSTFVAVP
jgi:hypothetical protein|tara:strand:+ start:174887 stop:174994 length:108 start_codon:yes stop_codon:yes gene_type:complete